MSTTVFWPCLLLGKLVECHECRGNLPGRYVDYIVPDLGEGNRRIVRAVKWVTIPKLLEPPFSARQRSEFRVEDAMATDPEAKTIS
jgi:hypothetical protein